MEECKSVLITGGTGSFGKNFALKVLRDYPHVRKVIIYSRDELKQFEMANLPEFKEHEERLRFFIGDVRDKERLKRACFGVDVLVHAAALKQVPAAEYNPIECINTNIYGAQNVIDAALDTEVKNVVALSTDKAAAPINLYGATKLCSDKLIVAANNMSGGRNTRLSVVRYGNVLGSRGSVVPFFMKKAKEGKLPITSSDMTRFNITLDEGINMVLYAIENAWGGEIFVPKIPSYRILDVAKAVGPNCEIEHVGIRPGEKIHEEMITETDSFSTVDCGRYYVILPNMSNWTAEQFTEEFSATRVERGFRYNSGENDNWLSVEEIRELIQENIDHSFKPT